MARGQRITALKERLQKKRSAVITPYDLFIVAITILSLVNAVLYIILNNGTLRITIGIIDFLLSGLFLVDFFRLLSKAQNKTYYFFRDFGWADLLASLPFPQFKFLRIFRLVKAYGIMRRAGLQGLRRGLAESPASAALLTVFFIIILLLEFGSVGILLLEDRSPNANIKTASDAIWWVYVTITTVGYGDRYPVTNGGRLFATFIMLVGVGLFGVITGFLANKFIPSSDKSSAKDTSQQDAAIAEMQQELKEIRALLVQQQAPAEKPTPKA
jgi:voltage-gated potassium channel